MVVQVPLSNFAVARQVGCSRATVLFLGSLSIMLNRKMSHRVKTNIEYLQSLLLSEVQLETCRSMEEVKFTKFPLLRAWDRIQ